MARIERFDKRVVQDRQATKAIYAILDADDFLVLTRKGGEDFEKTLNVREPILGELAEELWRMETSITAYLTNGSQQEEKRQTAGVDLRYADSFVLITRQGRDVVHQLSVEGKTGVLKAFARRLRRIADALEGAA